MENRWDIIINHFDKKKPIIGVELGVLEGETSRKLLEALPNLTLYMVDRWIEYTKTQRSKFKYGPDRKTWNEFQGQGFFDRAYKCALKVQKDYPNRAIIVKKDTVEAVKHVPNDLDFVFIDADHEYSGVRRDIEAWKDKIKKGGYLIGHDYTKSGVKRAVWDVFGFRVDAAKQFPNTWVMRI